MSERSNQLNRQEIVPDSLPFRLTQTSIIGTQNSCWLDLDGDGSSERVQYHHSNDNTMSLVFSDINNYVLTQHNVSGALFRSAGFPLLTANCDQDNYNEIIFGYIKGDTSYVEILDDDLETVISTFAVASAPEGFGKQTGRKFQAQPRPQYVLDFDDNGSLDVLLTFHTVFEPKPRGIFVFELGTGRLLAEFAMPQNPNWHSLSNHKTVWQIDLDGDGVNEFIPSRTYAVANGVSVNNMTDSHCYFSILDAQLNARHIVESGDEFSSLNVLPLQTPDGMRILTLFSPQSVRKTLKSQLRLYHPVTLQIERRTDDINEEILADFVVDDFNDNGQPDILVGTKSGRLILFNWQLAVQKTVEFSDRIFPSMTVDLDGDGLNEVICQSRNLLVLDKNLNILATVPNLHDVQLVYRGNHRPPQLAIRSRDKTEYVLYEYSRNYVSYVPTLLKISGAVIGVALLAFALSASRKLQRERRIRRVFMENSTLGILTIKRNGKIGNYNKWAKTLLSPAKGELEGLPFDEIMLHEKTSGIAVRLRDIFKGGAEVNETHESQTQNGSVKLTVQALPLRTRRGRFDGMLIILSDETSGVEHERVLTWSAIAQRLAHDIKSPLSTIGLTAQRLQMEYKKDEVQNHAKYDIYVRSILDETHHFQGVAKRFMQFVNLDIPTPTAIDLNMFFADYHKALAGNLPASIAVAVEDTDGDLSILADEDLFKSALQNVIENSVDAMKDTGSLVIRLDTAQPLQNQKGKRNHKSYVCIEITDTGKGIPSEKVTEIFKSSYSTKPGGTGMGLAITKKILNDHEGEIVVSSREGVGTSVFLYWPAA